MSTKDARSFSVNIILSHTSHAFSHLNLERRSEKVLYNAKASTLPACVSTNASLSFLGIAVDQYMSWNDCLNGCCSLATGPWMTKKHRRQRLSIPLSWCECFMTWTSDNAAHSQCHFRLPFSLGTAKNILLDEAKPKKTCKSPLFHIMVHILSHEPHRSSGR